MLDGWPKHAAVHRVYKNSFTITVHFLVPSWYGKIKLSHYRPGQVPLGRCFSTAGPWHQLYRPARGSPGICHL